MHALILSASNVPDITLKFHPIKIFVIFDSRISQTISKYIHNPSIHPSIHPPISLTMDQLIDSRTPAKFHNSLFILYQY